MCARSSRHGEQRAPGFTYARKQEYWHTEGNYDFIGVLSAERRAAWRMQSFTRAFAAGLRKVCVMDASAPERAAVRAYVRALPWPFPMEPADAAVKVRRGRVAAFRHPDGEQAKAGQVWMLGPSPTPATRKWKCPSRMSGSRSCRWTARKPSRPTADHRLTLELKGDRKMAPPVMVVDRSLSE